MSENGFIWSIQQLIPEGPYADDTRFHPNESLLRSIIINDIGWSIFLPNDIINIIIHWHQRIVTKIYMEIISENVLHDQLLDVVFNDISNQHIQHNMCPKISAAYPIEIVYDIIEQWPSKYDYSIVDDTQEFIMDELAHYFLNKAKGTHAYRTLIRLEDEDNMIDSYKKHMKRHVDISIEADRGLHTGHISYIFYLAFLNYDYTQRDILTKLMHR